VVRGLWGAGLLARIKAGTATQAANRLAGCTGAGLGKAATGAYKNTANLLQPAGR